MSLRRLMQQAATVETYLGGGAYGDTYAEPVVVACYAEDEARQVRLASGEEQVASVRLYAPISAAPGPVPAAGQLAPRSRVTVNGRPTYVLTVSRFDGAGPARVHHVEAALA